MALLATAVNPTTADKTQILFKAQIGLGGLKAVSKKPDLQRFLSFPLPLQAIHCTSDRSQRADSTMGSRFLHQSGDNVLVVNVFSTTKGAGSF